MGDADLRIRGHILLLLQLMSSDFTAIGSQVILQNKKNLWTKIKKGPYSMLFIAHPLNKFGMVKEKFF